MRARGGAGAGGRIGGGGFNKSNGAAAGPLDFLRAKKAKWESFRLPWNTGKKYATFESRTMESARFWKVLAPHWAGCAGLPTRALRDNMKIKIQVIKFNFSQSYAHDYNSGVPQREGVGLSEGQFCGQNSPRKSQEVGRVSGAVRILSISRV